MATTVYRHRRLDTNEIFYVGIGRERRPYSKKDRNEHWKNIVSKYGYTVEIIAEDLSKEDACELEVFLISINRFGFLSCPFSKIFTISGSFSTSFVDFIEKSNPYIFLLLALVNIFSTPISVNFPIVKASKTEPRPLGSAVVLPVVFFKGSI